MGTSVFWFAIAALAVVFAAAFTFAGWYTRSKLSAYIGMCLAATGPILLVGCVISIAIVVFNPDRYMVTGIHGLSFMAGMLGYLLLYAAKDTISKLNAE